LSIIAKEHHAIPMRSFWLFLADVPFFIQDRHVYQIDILSLDPYCFARTAFFYESTSEVTTNRAFIPGMGR
jgi:hypothetical protein